MMPTDENLYGQWPKCGEIDIMEVMGQETNKAYGTIHYGEPHDQSQGTCTVDAKIILQISIIPMPVTGSQERLPGILMV